MRVKHSILRVAAEAERRIIELLDKSLRDDLPDAPLEAPLQQVARPRQGQRSSG